MYTQMFVIDYGEDHGLHVSGSVCFWSLVLFVLFLVSYLANFFIVFVFFFPFSSSSAVVLNLFWASAPLAMIEDT